MGWTVLYVAFGLVALWLLGEVLLQYKARLRWRLLAFVGFLGVVVGVVLPSIAVIAVGAVAFAAGQTQVTLSFRRGYENGWVLAGRPTPSRRRRGAVPPPEKTPSLQVSDVEMEGAPAEEGFARAETFADPAYSTAHETAAEATAVFSPADPADQAGAFAHAGAAEETAMFAHAGADETAVFTPEPVPDDTGQYGVYEDAPAAAYAQQQAGHDEYAGYGTAYEGYAQQPAGHDVYGGQEAYAAQGAYQSQDPYAGQPGYATQNGYPGQEAPAASYDYGTPGQYHDYAAPYADPAAQQSYGGYDTGYSGRQTYTEPYDPYASDTPPGGVWMPQQRGDRSTGSPLPQEESYGYDGGQHWHQDQGGNQQY